MLPEQRRILEQASSSALIRLWHALLPLKTVVTVLQTGAHPDDETSRLLARLRSDGLRLAYACATRGQGGQNAIGPEAGADLGLLRTAEMEAAARALDIELHWLSDSEDDPITDFGFSKSGEDTLRRWGEQRLLERLVRVIRIVRPDIVLPTFLDVGGQHGHHQAITRMSEAAFHASADPAAFPEQGLEPWAAAKFYLPAFGGGGGSYDDEEPPPPATLTIEVGEVDPMFGATPAQMGEWSRVYHACQGMGRWLVPEPMQANLHLKASRVEAVGPESSILDGLPRALADLAEGQGSALSDAQAAIDEATAAFPDRARVANGLARACRLLAGYDVPARCRRIARTRELLASALAEALLVRTDLTVEPAVIAPGEKAVVRLTATAGFGMPDILEAELRGSGWRMDGEAVRSNTSGGPSFECSFRIKASDEIGLDPYGRSGSGGFAASMRFSFREALCTIAISPDAPVAFAPRASVSATPARIPVRIGAGSAAVAFRIAVENRGAAPFSGQIAVEPPHGWSGSPPMPVQLDAHGTRTASEALLVPPADLQPGLYTCPILLDGKPAHTATTIAYDHIRPIHAARAALVHIRAMDVALPEDTRIAFVDGGSDRAAEDFSKLGIAMEPLSDAALRAGDFSGLDTILVGVFAFRTRPALQAALPALKAWIEAGGNFLTLYHRPWDSWDPDATPPARIEIGQPSLRYRVTDPAAPVTVLAPEHALFNTPNRIRDEDWDEWVKERGLYFAKDWAGAYTPLLALADSGEAPHRGALLAGRFGRGRHVHVALALHTQLAHLVPGAYRLMANLLAKL